MSRDFDKREEYHSIREVVEFSKVIFVDQPVFSKWLFITYNMLGPLLNVGSRAIKHTAKFALKKLEN